MRDDSAEILFQSFLQEALVSSSGTDRDVHSLILSTKHFLCRLKDGFGEAVMACDMLEPCKFPSLDSCKKRFLCNHKEVYLATHPVVGLVLQVGDAEKFLTDLVIKTEAETSGGGEEGTYPGLTLHYQH